MWLLLYAVWCMGRYPCVCFFVFVQCCPALWAARATPLPLMQARPSLFQAFSWDSQLYTSSQLPYLITLLAFFFMYDTYIYSPKVIFSFSCGDLFKLFPLKLLQHLNSQQHIIMINSLLIKFLWNNSNFLLLIIIQYTWSKIISSSLLGPGSKQAGSRPASEVPTHF